MILQNRYAEFPVLIRAGKRGNQVFGANSRITPRERCSFSASPSANPAGTNKEIGIFPSTPDSNHSYWRILATGLVGFVAGLFLLAGSASPVAASCDAAASSGGLSVGNQDCKPIRRARIVNGKAYAPSNAPARVKKVIDWANKIRLKPYRYGGGHGSFFDSGYDCSGSVSFALRGGRFVSSPMASTGYMGWGQRGKGKWITVYSNPGHAYMIVAGLRFDTSMTPGNGPGWSKSPRSTPGTFSARHPGNF
ncbi:MAG: hypothetical protein KDB48_05930 [Solirubrobacterales bacterium]|nr:hypothetical protein [Solirubrobacterales bacterium]